MVHINIDTGPFSVSGFRIFMCNVQAVRPFQNGQTVDIHHSFFKVF